MYIAYENLYPPIPIFSLSYFSICAFAESSKGAAKVMAQMAAKVISIYKEKHLLSMIFF